MKRKILSFAISVLAATAANTNILAANENTESQSIQMGKTTFTENSWLRKNLPDNTLLYARIPSLLTSISSKDDSFKYALGNEQYTKVITQIKNAAQQWIKQSDTEDQPFLSLLVHQLNGPIEIAAIANGPIPQLLITASLDASSTDEINTLISTLIQLKAIQGEKTPLTNGAGELLTDIGPVPYRWDSQKKQLNLLVGLGGASVSQLDNTFSGLTENLASPMLLNEAKMDSSTKGLYLWFNNKLAYPMYKVMAPSHINQQLSLFGVPDISSVALSWGVRNEKGRIKLLLEAPPTGLIRELVPTNANKLTLEIASNPNVTALISLPSAKQFSKIEQTILSMSPKTQSYLKAKQKLKDNLGFSIEDVLASVGPELIGISDNVGEYSAIQIRDHEKFDQLINLLSLKDGVQVTKKQTGTATFTYMKLPSFIDDDITKELKDMPYFLSEVLTKGNTHLYWQQEGDYLVLSDLPQVLFDRKLQQDKNKQPQTLSQWLTQNQKVDLTASTIAITGSVSNSPRRLYYAYLKVIQFLADITSAEIDTFSLPSANQLNLAQEGTLGFQIDSNLEGLGFELTFESTPADILLTTQGFASIASIGLLSAIAIPAYQDYTLRAQTSHIMANTESAKTLVQQSFIDLGRMPNAQEAKDLSETFNLQSQFSLNILPDTGKIVVNLLNKPGKVITLEPLVTEGSLDWSCHSNLRRSLLPENCR